MSQVVFSKVIHRLLATYGRPNVPDPDALFDEFIKALAGFSESILSAAMDVVIREHRYQSWPTIGEVMARCQDVSIRREEDRERDIRRHEAAMAAETKVVDPDAVARVQSLVANYAKGLDCLNSFPDIVRRCPIGGTINISAPWGQEVRDRDGRVVPIREKKAGHEHWRS